MLWLTWCAFSLPPSPQKLPAELDTLMEQMASPMAAIAASRSGPALSGKLWRRQAQLADQLRRLALQLEP